MRQVIGPPYPATLTIPGAAWHSPLAYHGKAVLARPSVQIGRMEGNDLVLSDLLVSRHHAVIRWTPSGYELEDLGSANGTFVSGQRIQGRVFLTPGQTIQIGTTHLLFTVFDPVDPAGTVPGTPGSNLGAAYPMAAPEATAISQHPNASSASGVATGSHPFYAMLSRRRENAVGRFIRTEWSKQYWRIFLLGLIAYFVVAEVLLLTQNLHMVPLELLLASCIIPVVFVIFCFEQNAFADMPFSVVSITFMSGAILGLTIAAILEPLLLPPTLTSGTTITLGTALLIGLCEESAKVVAVLWFLRDKRLRSELDGLILGAAAGMGFAALETAGYGFVAFLTGFANSLSSNPSTAIAIDAGLNQMNHSLILRMALAVFGHGVWTAIVCAAIWRDRGQSTFRLTSGVILAFSLAVILHALWDWAPFTTYLSSSTDPLTVVVVVLGWFVLIGGIGLLVLSFFLRDAVTRAKLGPAAPPPPPLLQAFLVEILRPFRRRSVAQPSLPLVTTPSQIRYCPRCQLMYSQNHQTCDRCQGPLVSAGPPA
jgi:RsiW-degrading membrane proteinase PrsW (M82 family)